MDLVVGRLTAAHVVVVHRRQVGVGQRGGGGELERGGKRKHMRGLASERLGGTERQYRPDALAAREQAVAHGVLETLRHGLAAEGQRLQVVVDLLLERDRICSVLHRDQSSSSW